MRIRLENVNKVYPNNFEAVKNISFEIDENEFVVLVGPSGCGKTTILRMIAGLEDISSGKLFFDDTLMNDIEPAKRNVGMVFQSYALYPHFSVYKNLAFPLLIQKVDKKVIDTKVREIATLLKLENFLHYKPKELSGGQRQRVALGRALIKQPKVFLFDEPLSNIDAHLRQSLRTEILEIQRRYKIPALYVTHDQTEAMAMGDKIVVLKDGYIQQIATPNEIYEFPQNLFVATFIGSPQINVFHGKIIKGEKLEFEENQTKLKFAIRFEKDNTLIDKISTLCIRPENLWIKSSYESENCFPAIIKSIEFLGFDTIINFQIAGSSNFYCIRTTEQMKYKINEQVYIYYNPQKILLYDSDGKLIRN